MGVVYKARQPKLDRTVALKMILSGGHASESDLARFISEAQAVAQLQHPNVVQLFESGQHNGLPYFTLEFVPGGSLAQTLSGVPLPPQEAAHLVQQLARGMQAAHERGIVHRDLKPANVLLVGPVCRTGPDDSEQPDSGPARQAGPTIPKITDFGLAKRVENGSGVTTTGAIMGTPSYMVPEQASGEGKHVGPAADVYALGAILYECLSGRPPFRAATPIDTVLQVISDDPVPPTQLQSTTPRDLETICLKCLEKDPNRRYATAQDLADELGRFLNGEPIQARSIGRIERGWRWCRRNPALAFVSVLAVVALVATAAISLVFAIYQSQSAADLSIALQDARDKGTLAEKRRQESEKQTRLAKLRLADSYLKRARTLCEQGEVSRGMLWLTRSFEIAPTDAGDLRWAIRANLAHWSRQMPALRALLKEDGAVRLVAFSPDSRTFLTECGNKTVRLWDAVTRRTIRKLPHHGSLNTVAFSPDGKTVLTLGEGNSAQLWRLHSGKPACQAFQHEGTVSAVAISPDGKNVLTGSMDGTARLWDATTGNAIGEPFRHPPHVHSVAFGPDGKIIATGGRDKTARFWNTSSGEQIGQPLRHFATVSSIALDKKGWTMTGAGRYARLWDADGKLLRTMNHPPGPIHAARFSPDGKTVLTTSTGSRYAWVWDAGAIQTKPKRLTNLGFLKSASFSPDGRTLLTGGSDTTAQFWNVHTESPIGPALQHLDYVETTAFSPDGKLALTGSLDRLVRLWDARIGTAVAPPLRHPNRIKAVAFAPDNSFVVTGGWGPIVRKWDARTGELLNTSMAHPNHVLAVAVSPDSRLILTGCEDGKARLWEAATGKLIRLFAHQNGMQAVAFSPDGRTIATGSRDCTVRLWETATGKPVSKPLRHADSVFTVAYSPDGKYVAAGCHDNTAHVWNAATGKPTGIIVRHQSPIWSVAFSPDGKLLLTGSEDRTAQLWDRATGASVGAALQHKGPVKAVAFSPDGKILLTGDVKDTAHLWDARTGNRIGPALRHNGWVECVAFSRDGKTIATGSGDRTVRLWRVPPPVRGNREPILLWTQLITGMEMDEAGAVHALDAQTWQQRRRQLDKLGGSPAKSDNRLTKAKPARPKMSVLPIIKLISKDSDRPALALNGNGDHITTAFVPFDEYKAFTVEAWVKDWTEAILCQGQSRDPENSLWISMGRNTTGIKPEHSCGWESGKGRNHEFSVGYGKANEWNHLAMVFDGARQFIFLNGVFQSARPAHRPGPFVTTRRLIIGAHNHGRLVCGSGLLGPVRISKVARYAKSFTPSLSWTTDKDSVLLYDMKQGKGKQLLDASGNGRHGVIHGAMWVSPQR